MTTARMTRAETLAELIANNRGVKRTISYLETETSERVVSYEELYQRALGILFHLQKLGARPGDKLIIYLANNEQFLDAFWAGMLGGIIPVPVALGVMRSTLPSRLFSICGALRSAGAERSPAPPSPLATYMRRQSGWLASDASGLKTMSPIGWMFPPYSTRSSSAREPDQVASVMSSSCHS